MKNAGDTPGGSRGKTPAAKPRDPRLGALLEEWRGLARILPPAGPAPSAHAGAAGRNGTDHGN